MVRPTCPGSASTAPRQELGQERERGAEGHQADRDRDRERQHHDVELRHRLAQDGQGDVGEQQRHHDRRRGADAAAEHRAGEVGDRLRRPRAPSATLPGGMLTRLAGQPLIQHQVPAEGEVDREREVALAAGRRRRSRLRAASPAPDPARAPSAWTSPRPPGPPRASARRRSARWRDPAASLRRAPQLVASMSSGSGATRPTAGSSITESSTAAPPRTLRGMPAIDHSGAARKRPETRALISTKAGQSCTAPMRSQQPVRHQPTSPGSRLNVWAM